MKNDIGSTLNQMYSKNRKLEEVNEQIKKCQISKKAYIFKINVGLAEPGLMDQLYEKNVESFVFEPNEELRDRILIEMEKYYKELAERCYEELKALLENLKSL